MKNAAQLGGNTILFAVMTCPRFDLLAAVRANAVDHKLNTGAVSAVSAELMASLAIPDRIGVNIVFRAFTRRVAPLSPFIHRIEARTTVGAAVFATFLLQLADVRMRFRPRAVVSAGAAGIGLCGCRITYHLLLRKYRNLQPETF